MKFKYTSEDIFKQFIIYKKNEDSYTYEEKIKILDELEKAAYEI